MVVYTNSPKVRSARRTNLRLILSQHDARCALCVRSGNCTLQKLANDHNLVYTPYETKLRRKSWGYNAPLIRDENKCIKCMRCVQVCDKHPGYAHLGHRRNRLPHHHRRLPQPPHHRDGLHLLRPVHYPLSHRQASSSGTTPSPVFDALADPDRITTVVQIAPAVRAAWAEAFNLSRPVCHGQADGRRPAADWLRLCL